MKVRPGDEARPASAAHRAASTKLALALQIWTEGKSLLPHFEFRDSFSATEPERKTEQETLESANKHKSRAYLNLEGAIFQSFENLWVRTLLNLKLTI